MPIIWGVYLNVGVFPYCTTYTINCINCRTLKNLGIFQEFSIFFQEILLFSLFCNIYYLHVELFCTFINEFFQKPLPTKK